MQSNSRRQFLRNSALIAAGAATLGWKIDRACAQAPHLIFPRAPRGRIAVASWPFRMFISAPDNRWSPKPPAQGIDLTEFPALVVRHFGIRNIEPLDEHFRSTAPAYVLEVRRAIEKAGCRAVDIPCAVHASFYDPDPAQRQVAVENGKKWIDVASQVGSPSIRAHVQGKRGVVPAASPAAESLKRLADYGATKNVIVNLENDDNRTEDPFFLVEVIKKVASPYLRALPDFCNSMMTHDQDFNNRAMEAMFKYAYNIAHMKDSEGDGHGNFRSVDVQKCFEIAKAQGYRGYFSMEWEGNGEPYAGTQKLIDETLKYLT